ncbi:hypothetical protein DFP73DRAFT_528052 [Morchella snyderi]|nr:hypothetical protein DFP73DRAFT_528052 [Morchella snyderi]
MAQNKYEYQSSAGGLDWECHKRLLSVENDIRYIRDSFQHLNATVFQCRVHPGKAGWTLQEYLVLWGLALTFVIIIQLVGDGKIINLRVAQLFTAADVNHGVATGVRLAAAGGGEATHHLSQPSKNSLYIGNVVGGCPQWRM